MDLFHDSWILLQANLKQFMAAVRAHNVDSVSKFTTRGLDPNFQEHDTGGKLIKMDFSQTKVTTKE